MAKISARGATEVARLNLTSSAGHDWIYVLASDGRVLTRPAGDAGTSYTIRGKIPDPARRTGETLAEIARRDGMTTRGGDPR